MRSSFLDASTVVRMAKSTLGFRTERARWDLVRDLAGGYRCKARVKSGPITTIQRRASPNRVPAVKPTRRRVDIRTPICFITKNNAGRIRFLADHP
jgi:hypothetical protein